MPGLDPSFDPKDALNTQDDSEVLDHSAGTQPSNYTQNFLQGREQNFGYSRSQQVRLSRNAAQQHEEAITNPDNLAKRENTAGVGLSSGGDKPDKEKLTNPMNYLSGKNGNSSRSPLSAASIKAKVRRRVIAGVVAGLLGLGGLGIGIMGPSILSGKILDVIEEQQKKLDKTALCYSVFVKLSSLVFEFVPNLVLEEKGSFFLQERPIFYNFSLCEA